MNDLIYRGGRKPTPEQVRKAAAELYDMNPSIAACGVTRQAYIDSRLCELDIEPDQAASAAMGMGAPTMSTEGAMRMRTVDEIVSMAAAFEGDDGMDRHSRIETPEARAAITSAIDQEWSESSAVLSAMGLTAEQYRLSRLRDVGLETLPSAARS